MADWTTGYFAGELTPTEVESTTVGTGSRFIDPANTGTVRNGGPIGRGLPSEADPVLIVGAVLGLLEARGVPTVVDHSLDRAIEAAGRLLRCLGVEATDAWTAAV